MHCPTVWATEVEIFSAAQMLDTDIFFCQVRALGCDFNLQLPLTVAATSILNSHYT